MSIFHTSERPTTLHTREGLMGYLDTPVERPTDLTDAQYECLTPQGRRTYDASRVAFISGGDPIATPDLKETKKLLLECMRENVGRNSGHHGVMLDGASTLGKTTILKALMKYVQVQYSREFPEFRQHDRVPVVFMDIPSNSTGKLLMQQFASFFGLHVRTGESMGSIRNRVVDTLNAAGTQLIVVDELHNLDGRSRGLGESVDLLKNLHNELAATFIYAGIDLTTSALLSGPRGKQLASRFSLVEMTRFNLGNPDHLKIWRGLLPAFEKALPLRHHEPGTLASLSDYLWQRTDGSIGSLSRLINGSAIEVITNPNITVERIDEALLQSRKLDLTAEQRFKIRPAAKTRSTSATKATAA
ncbi:MAG: TniB family NTP-binding protein [Rhodoglobus sp.]